MTGIAIELLLSFIFLRYFEKVGLEALGVYPNRRRIMDFISGLLLTITYFVLLMLAISYYTENPYHLNNDYSFRNFISTVYYIVKSVLYEDLIFRGALLYILMKRTSHFKAILISSFAFGIYHWFSFNVFGSPVQMLIVFLQTASAGYIFALAYRKTCSMYLPFAMHFGANFSLMILFSKDLNIGSQLLLKSYDKDPVIPNPFIGIVLLLLYYTGYQLFSYIYLQSIKKPLIN
jgi:membrane protease YdiL (CAAX protease family)